MQVYVKDRRRSPRLRVRLLFSVSVCRSGNANGSSRELILKGHTRDLSTNGLALNVPQIHLNGHHLAAGGRELQLSLELPGGPISIVVAPRRYEQLEAAELGCNYLIGVRITKISEEDRQRYIAFITQSLGALARP
jgi:hypothetical protein